MVNITVDHSTKWFAPSPLWARQSTAGIQIADEAVAARPSILRFANDQFMDELLAIVDDAPDRLNELLVQPETWRKPGVGGNPTRRNEQESPIARILNRIKIEADGRRIKRPVALIRNPDKVPAAAPVTLTPAEPLKLYQSAHQRHYLVCASLISREAGLPDKAVELNDGECATFVVRRLTPPAGVDPDTVAVPDSTWDEYAFLLRGRSRIWRRIGGHQSAVTRHLSPNEEQTPLFPLFFEGECCRRQLHAGVIPVGKREQFMSAPAEGAPSLPELTSGADAGGISFGDRSRAREIFQTDVAEPWKALINQAQYKLDSLGRSPDNFNDLEDRVANTTADRTRMVNTARDMIQTASWYIVLDLARFLEEFLPSVWRALTGDQARASLGVDEARLIDLLEATVISGSLKRAVAAAPYAVADVKSSLADALLAIRDHEDDLETVKSAFTRFDKDADGDPIPIDPKWPSFLFPLADPVLGGPVPPTLSNTELRQRDAFEKDKEQIDALADLVERMAPADPPDPGTEATPPQTQLDHKYAWFVVRCVYERPCCGPLFPPLMSAPTQMFQMAPFFDPDAPARPIRIPMPVDITPAGLRKYKKNTAFVLSDMLCGRLRRMKKYTLGDLVLSVLPWPFHKDLPDPGETGPCKDPGGLEFGMICSLSIPIVTLCAFILLIIMVTLFDLFFRWIPYLMVCLPIPGLKSK